VLAGCLAEVVVLAVLDTIKRLVVLEEQVVEAR
jgi:hypothetical protein